MRAGLVAAAIAVLVLAGCGGSSPKGPPALLLVSTDDGDYAIFGADANGKHVRRLTKEKGDPSTPRGLFFQIDPAWSPDGRSIAFASTRAGNSHVYVMRADGTGTRRLTSSRQDDGHPSWSPDGKRLVFAREGALFVVSAQGGEARRLGRGQGNSADPSWAPDGGWIAYDYRAPGSSIRELYLIRPDGTGNHRLTRIDEVSALPAWSPDSTRIAFQSNARLGHFEIYTIERDGTGLRQISRSLVDAIQPTWSPDGRITFARDGKLWIDTNGRQSKLTSGQNDSAPAWRPVPPNAE